ncbi:MAG: transcriptional repressor [Clostridiaceae bacterium]|nr:transcriptional repressor [Clostridiaceae bacterium]
MPKSVNTIIERFNDKNIRLTPQRISVYQYLLENRIHPTVDTVYTHLKKSNPSLSKTTIYNTIDALSSAGLIRTIIANEGEARLDAYTDFHGHFFCSKCGMVADFCLDGCSFPDQIEGYEMNTLEVRATGYCPKCRLT